MARNRQVGRILKLLQYFELNPRGLKVDELLSKLIGDGHTCSRETLYRDLSALRSHHFPLRSDSDGEHAVWKLDGVVQIACGIHISYEELIALYIARESLKTLAMSPIYEALDSFFGKLERLLGPKAHDAFKEFSAHLSVRATPTWASTVSHEIMDVVYDACVEGHVLEIQYRPASGKNAGQITTRRLGPYHLHFQDAGGYLIAKDFEDGVIKRFALARIKKAIMLQEAFEPSHFVAEEFHAQSIGMLGTGELESIVLLIDEPLASYIAERRFHHSQEIAPVKKGIRISMKVKLNDELVRWVLSLGPWAEVESPEILRNTIREMAERIISRSKKTA